MDKTGWPRSTNYHADKRASISDIWNVAESRSAPWYFSRFDHRRKGFEIRKETYGSVQCGYMYTRAFAPTYGWKSIVQLCKYAGSCLIISLFLIKWTVCTFEEEKVKKDATTCRYWCWMKQIVVWIWALRRPWIPLLQIYHLKGRPCCFPRLKQSRYWKIIRIGILHCDWLYFFFFVLDL